MFYWGVSTSSYQIEGAAYEDGKGPSIWDRFSHIPGKIEQEDHGDVACDHYHRYREDVSLLREIGVNAYRFSISWPRILPDGTGKICEKGLDFYDRLTEALLEKGIEPFVTLYHWDLPDALEKNGGFFNERMAEWFAEYTDAVTRRLGDRCKHYMTFNEPHSMIGGGYEYGIHAPGRMLPYEETFMLQKNVLTAHGAAVGVIHQNVPEAKIGIACGGETFFPVNGDPESVELARKCTFRNDKTAGVAWLLDPIVLGKFAESANPCYGAFFAQYESDLKLISAPIDFIGLNLYGGIPVCTENGFETIGKYGIGAPFSTIGSYMNEQALYYMLKFTSERYGKPVFVSENGFSENDWICLDGKVHDSYRVDYLNRHLDALMRAKRDGADVPGYFVWSFLDNFEWSFGYGKRFGLVYVDFETQRRVLKDSAYFYRDYIREHSLGG